MTLIYSSSNTPKVEKTESQKVSYWLEKLFKQREKFTTKQQISPSSTNPLELETVLPQAEVQSIEEKGLVEAVKSHANKAEKNRQAVEDMVSNSNRILLRISSVFPWQFFPSHIIVEETRLTIIHRQLFSSQVQSVDIKNISNIFIDNGILFSQLTIVSDTFAQNQVVISSLFKKEAILMRRIIEGLRLFVSKDIDTTGYSVEELISKLKELSTTKTLF